ncbi:MAG: FemAB family PEP-CTERM system-associated protein [Planctomycetes bacterium]|nr:FemAB family PEP-CTERM system-associated protein [Planctomycetota bacterium]
MTPEASGWTPRESADEIEPQLRLGTSADDGARDDYVRAHRQGTFFHLAGWRDVIEREMGHEPADLLAFREGRLVGVLPLMRAPGPVTRRSLISMPFAVYGGPLGDSPLVAQRLVQAAMEAAERGRAGRLELRCIEDGGLPLAPCELYATFVRDLPRRPEDVLALMPKKARAEARKAREKHALVLTEGRWYLDDFVRMFHENKRKLGSPGLPHSFFWALCKRFGDDVRIHMVHRGREPVASVMSFLYGGDLLAYYSGAVEGADRQCSASNFMYMALQEWAVGQGLRRFDFGRSRRDSGAYTFKEHQGFTPTPLQYRFHFVRDRALPTLTPSNPRTKILRDTWARMPMPIARKLSEELCRYLP